MPRGRPAGPSRAITQTTFQVELESAQVEGDETEGVSQVVVQTLGEVQPLSCKIGLGPEPSGVLLPDQHHGGVRLGGPACLPRHGHGPRQHAGDDPTGGGDERVAQIGPADHDGGGACSRGEGHGEDAQACPALEQAHRRGDRRERDHPPGVDAGEHQEDGEHDSQDQAEGTGRAARRDGPGGGRCGVLCGRVELGRRGRLGHRTIVVDGPRECFPPGSDLRARDLGPGS